MSGKRISIFPILLVNFSGTLGLSIVFPFLVFLVAKFGGDAVMFGILGAVYPAFQLIGAPLLGKWSDIYGRKRILLLSSIGTLIGWIIFFISFFLPLTAILDLNLRLTGQILMTLPLLVLFIARVIDGLTGGNVSVANAYLADITTDEERNKDFGRLSISSNLGYILGPALAGILGGTIYEEKLPVVAAGIISIITIIIIFFFLPDSEPHPYKEEPESAGLKKIFGYQQKECYEITCEEKGGVKINLKKVLSIKSIPYFLFLNFLIYLGFNFFYTAFPVHVMEKLGWSISEMGIYFSVISLLMVIAQGPLLTFASKHFPENKLIFAGSFILATNFVMLLSDNIFVLYLAAVFFAIGNGLMWPSFLSLLSKAAGKKYQGSVQGYASSAGSLASIVGLIAGGILYTLIGEATFLIAAAAIYLVFVLSFISIRSSFEVAAYEKGNK